MLIAIWALLSMTPRLYFHYRREGMRKRYALLLTFFAYVAVVFAFALLIVSLHIHGLL